MSHGIDEISRPSSAWRLAQGIGLRFFRLEGACKRTQFRVSPRLSLLWVLCRGPIGSGTRASRSGEPAALLDVAS